MYINVTCISDNREKIYVNPEISYHNGICIYHLVVLCKTGSEGAPTLSPGQLQSTLGSPPLAFQVSCLLSPACCCSSPRAQNIQPPQEASALGSYRSHPKLYSKVGNGNSPLGLLRPQHPFSAVLHPSYPYPAGCQSCQKCMPCLTHLSKISGHQSPYLP